MRTSRLLLTLLVVLSARAPIMAQHSAAVLERPTSWTKGNGGAVRLLASSGFTVKSLDLGKTATAQGVDLIVFGTFASQHKDYQNYMRLFGGSLAPFVSAGGVVLQFTQADQTEARVPFLPSPLVAERNDEDIIPILVHDGAHPLLKDLTLTRGQLVLSSYLGRRGNWETISRQFGFRVLMGVDPNHRRKVLLEGAHGKGRIIITSLYLDTIYNAAGLLQAPADWHRAARALFSGVARYVGLVKTGRAPKVIPTPPYSAPKPYPFVPGSFTLVALPDTQVYCERYPHHYYAQTKWIADNTAKYNIKYVLHLGDITNRNTRVQWAVAKKAMSTLDGVVPYAMAPGNHDYGPGGNAANRTTFLNDYFKVKDHERWPTFGGVMEPGRLDNSFHTFGGLGEEFLVLALEFGPRNKVVDWANKIVAQHPDHRVILITHAYMYNDNTRYDWKKYGARQKWNPHAYRTARSPEGTNDGEELFQKLVRKHPNFLMTLNGHVLGDGLAFLSSRCDWGNEGSQMLVNYQMKKEGGQGFMRLLEFLPDGETVQVKAWSPSLRQYKTDPGNQFKFKLKAPIAVKAR